MRRFWLLLLITLVPCAARAQTAPVTTAAGGGARQSPVSASEVLWSTSEHVRGYSVSNSGYGETAVKHALQLRHMSVTLTNTSDVPVESVRFAFVFSDPATGEEWFRYKSHIKGRLLPGECAVVEKVATASLGVPPRDMRAKKSVVVTEIKYADGSVWKRK